VDEEAVKRLLLICMLSACVHEHVEPDAGVDAMQSDSGVDTVVDAEPDAYVPACWQYHQSHCVTTNGGIEQICIPYDGCGCYRCLDEQDAGSYCYCGPGGL
jgi:hypothetical protein